MLRCLFRPPGNEHKGMVSKRFRWFFCTMLFFVVVGVKPFLWIRHTQLFSQTNSTPSVSAGAPSVSVRNRAERNSGSQDGGQQSDSPSPPTGATELPPGTISLTLTNPSTPLTIARKHLSESSFMTVAEFESAIRAANHGKTSFRKNDQVLLPGIESQPIVEASRPFPKEGEIRAIYLTG